MKVLAGAITALCLGTPAAAGDVTVNVQGIATAQGRIFVALCDKDHFMDPNCPIQKSAPTNPARVAVSFEGVKPGRYVVMVFQDVNSNGKIDFTLAFIPKEPWGMSGPKVAIPSFAKNAVEIGQGPLSFDIALRN